MPAVPAGLVTTLVSPGEEEDRLLRVARQLGIEIEREEAPGPEVVLGREVEGGKESEGGEGLDKLRSGLEDLFHLY